jgi:hypothetical protein
VPKHGGRYCVGRRVRYQSCSTEDCQPSPASSGDGKGGYNGVDDDFRAKQCADFDYSNFNIQGLPKNVQWVAKYTGSKTQFPFFFFSSTF